MKRLSAYRFFTSKFWLPLVAGATLMQLNFSGCDPTVRDSLLTGLQTSLTGLVSTIISTFFLALQGNGSTTSGGGSTTSQPVVQAVFDHLLRWVA